jgi:aspartate 1-decarboxylase
MNRTMMKSKLHRATVTEADLHYQGSVAIDESLLEAADILIHERVEIYNITNGERFATYAIPAPAGSGTIMINGAAAHKARPGDLVIIVSYADYSDAEARRHTPTVLLMKEGNEVEEILRPALGSPAWREAMLGEARLMAV